MATDTNDLGAHLNSLPLQPNSVSMLNGRRYNNVNRWEANQWFKIPEASWNAVRDNPTTSKNGFIYVIRWYAKHHYLYQSPRLLSLYREFLSDNPIHYWKSNKFKRADNRIASSFAQHATNFKKGLLFGKPIKYGYDNTNNKGDTGKNLLQTVKNFNSSNDTSYHDALLGQDALITGRAYELTYIQAGTNDPKVVRLNPSQCFILWSTDVEPKELCAVRYYMVRVADRSWYQIEVYNNNGKIYYFWSESIDGGWRPLQNPVDNVLGDVPVTEYILSRTRQGCFENALDYFDAYDKAISGMANSQEDFNNMTMVVSGKVHTPKRLTQATHLGNKIYYKHGKPHTWSNMVLQSRDKSGNANDPVIIKTPIPTRSNVLFLKPYIKNGQVVNQPSAQYLTKSLDANEWQVYINELTNKIEQFTGVPNLEDNSSSNQTQLETASKLMSTLNEAKEYENNFRHGLNRRLKLIYDYWNKVGGYSIGNSDPSDITVHFVLNLPLNVQETISKIQSLNQTNKVSTKTIQELAGTLDNVPQSEEANRLSEEQSSQSSNNRASLNNGFQDEVNASNAANPANSSDNDLPNDDDSDSSGTNMSKSSDISDNSASDSGV